MFGPNQAFVSGVSDPSFGIFEPQSGGPIFSNSSFSGNYLGASSPAEFSGSTEADSVTADGAGNINGATDVVAVPGFPAFGTVSDTYAILPDGRGRITQNGTLTYVLYVVSPTKIVLLPTIANPYVVKLSN
jgi:hypothetical protein